MDLRGLDFSAGLEFERRIQEAFGKPINVPPLAHHLGFLLVVSFGRSKYRLTEESVGSLLQATIGGSADLFRVLYLSDRVFRFSVSSSQVGFEVYKTIGFSCEFYKLSFHLWGSGGATWIRESLLFDKEESNSWQYVGSNNRKSNSAKSSTRRTFPLSKGSVFDRLQHCQPLTGANLEPIATTNPWQVHRSSDHSGSKFKNTNSVTEALHSSRDCRNKQRCRSCLQWGHLVGSCTKVPVQAPEPSPPPPPAPMAYQRADPTPFLPRGMHWQAVEHRTPVMRAVLRRPQPRNEHVAIVTIDPLPGNLIHFNALSDVLREFLVDVRRLDIIDIQPTHLGQAYVRFLFQHDCENLIENSPHAFDYINISFVKHNRGRNWKSVQFNRDCWVMLMGFPLDYWEQEYLDQAFCPFGHVLKWEKDKTHLARLIVKARVIDLESVPQFIVISDPDSFQGESWTVQCEILQGTLLGGLRPDEDPAPDAPLNPHALFDFFGLGQPGHGPQIGGDNMAEGGQDDQGWDPWPEEIPAQQDLGFDLNAAPDAEINNEEQAPAAVEQQPFQMIIDDWMGDEDDEELPDPQDPQENQPFLQVQNADAVVAALDAENVEVALHQAFPPDVGHQNLHLGFMHFVDRHQSDPVWAERSNHTWTQMFPEMGSSGSGSVTVPVAWAAFFTMLLLSPTHYSWAKDFVSSGAMDFFHDLGPSVPLKIPIANSFLALQSQRTHLPILQHALKPPTDRELAPQ
ncbi:hypothetical protein BS78_02G100600 [Paspalum vaginatum]|nr:hypothetical protein BS78_02G100600 [Paspalum vaginatum]